MPSAIFNFLKDLGWLNEFAFYKKNISDSINIWHYVTMPAVPLVL